MRGGNGKGEGVKRVNGKDRKQKMEWTEDRRWDGLIKKKVGRTEYRKR